MSDEDNVNYVLDRLEKMAEGCQQTFADNVCDFFPECSRFQIHARVFKKDMRNTLGSYIAETLK